MVGIIPLGGGMTIGFEQAGFQDVGVNLEVSEEWTANLRLNRPHLKHATSLDEWEEYVETLRDDPPQLVYGSPPCQGVTGASKTSSLDNPKNQWMLHFTRAAMNIGPDFVVFENIPRMLSIGRQIVNDVQEIARKNNYTMTVHHHNAEDFGICQRRKRVMFVLEKKGHEISWPSHPHLTAPTVMQTIGDLDLIEPSNEPDAEFQYVGQSQNDWQHVLRNPEGKTWNHDFVGLPDRFEHVPLGAPWMAMPEEYMTPKEIERIEEDRLYNAMELFKFHPDRVARTLTGARNKIHPLRNRIISVREASRLMAFPDEWKWAKPKDFQQFAAGVCPPICRWYGEVLQHHLSGTTLTTTEGKLF
jgi:DNA (cytosine-5)-methyltransferase 1